LQPAYERLPHPSGSNWQGGDRIDPVQARNLREDRHLDAMREVERLEVVMLRAVRSFLLCATPTPRRRRPRLHEPPASARSPAMIASSRDYHAYRSGARPR
jgi:hypothetical protein